MRPSQAAVANWGENMPSDDGAHLIFFAVFTARIDPRRRVCDRPRSPRVQQFNRRQDTPEPWLRAGTPSEIGDPGTAQLLRTRTGALPPGPATWLGCLASGVWRKAFLAPVEIF